MSDYTPDGDFVADSPLKNDIPVLEALGLCHVCTRRTGVMTCSAFPQGIPVIILKGDFLHTEPYPGDQGRQFIKRLA